MLVKMIDILCLKVLRWTGVNLAEKSGPLVIDTNYTNAVEKKAKVEVSLSGYWQFKVIVVERKLDRIKMKLVIPGMSINIITSR